MTLSLTGEQNQSQAHEKKMYPFSNQGKIIALEKRFSSLYHHAQIEMRFPLLNEIIVEKKLMVGFFLDG